jgi:hypothetical protein
MEFLRKNEIWVFFAGILSTNLLFVGATAHDFLPMSL